MSDNIKVGDRVKVVRSNGYKSPQLQPGARGTVVSTGVMVAEVRVDGYRNPHYQPGWSFDLSGLVKEDALTTIRPATEADFESGRTEFVVIADPACEADGPVPEQQPGDPAALYVLTKDGRTTVGRKATFTGETGDFGIYGTGYAVVVEGSVGDFPERWATLANLGIEEDA